MTGCAWSATSNASWLTATGSGTANGTVQYTAASNTTGASRSGTISVGTQSFTVTQPAACTFTLNPFTYQADPNGASSTFQVQVSPNSCAWTATSNNPEFVTITSGTSAMGNGTVGFTVASNTTQNPRSGSIAVGTTAFTIYQPGGQPCAFVLSAGSASLTPSGGPGSFTVTTTCSWTPTTAVDWITINSPSTVTGNGLVGYLVLPNTSSAARSSSISVGNQSFFITQSGVACNVTVAQAAVTAPPTGVQGALDVTAPDGCSWTAASGATWITLGAGSGSGQGSVAYTIAPNTLGKPRTSTITISNQAIKVTQDAADCSGQTLTPNHAELPASGGTFGFTVSTACSFTAVADNGWIRIVSGASGTGTGDVGYTVSANSSPDARMGTVTVGTQTFPVSQSGTSCSLSLNSGAADVPASGGSGSFNVTASAACRWQPVTDVGWIHLTYASANGNGKVNYSADITDQTQPRTGKIFINGQVFQLTQGARPPLQVTGAGVLNAASFASGALAPGEILTIFGDGIGPDAAVGPQLTTDQKSLATALAGIRVLFDGDPAALIYVSRTQISAIVPYSVDQKTSTQMEIEYQGFRSAPIALDVTPSAPAIFTIDASGKGQGAILNQDNITVNSAGTPAARDSVVILFATGEGQTNPAGVDGKLAVRPLPRPILTVTAQIGGVNAPVIYAGAAPGLPAGVLQVNVRVPLQIPPGPQPVVITIGDASSQVGVTVAVQ